MNETMYEIISDYRNYLTLLRSLNSYIFLIPTMRDKHRTVLHEATIVRNAVNAASTVIATHLWPSVTREQLTRKRSHRSWVLKCGRVDFSDNNCGHGVPIAASVMTLVLHLGSP